MALTKKSWALNTYTPGAWTDFIAGSAGGDIAKGIEFCNTTGSTILLSMRVATSGGASKSNILNNESVAPGKSYKLAQDPLNLVGQDKLQINANLAGLEFYASGV